MRISLCAFLINVLLLLLHAFFFGEQKVFREEVKEQLKWNVDRSTASNKLRDLLEWSTDIIDDIYYQRRIRSAVVIDLLIRGWYVNGFQACSQSSSTALGIHIILAGPL